VVKKIMHHDMDDAFCIFIDKNPLGHYRLRMVAWMNGQLASKKKFSFFGLILFVSEKETTL
jgi:hypothetical protein